jgi:hypothetical protein
MNAVRCEIDFETIDHGDGLEPFVVQLSTRNRNSHQQAGDDDDDDDDDGLDEILDSLDENNNAQNVHQLQGNTVQV